MTYRSATGLKGNESLLLQRVDYTVSVSPTGHRLVQRLQTPGRTGEIDARGVELKERIHEVFSRAGDSREPIREFKVAGGGDDGIAFPGQIELLRRHLETNLGDPHLFFRRSQ